jgi:RAT1-interacting protein
MCQFVSIDRETSFVAGKYAGNTDNFVELKTSLSIRGPQDEAKFEK